MTMNTLKIREMYLQPGRPKIAIPVVSTDPAEIKNECVEITEMPCDMIEWRADKYLSAVPDLEEKLKQKEFYLDSVKLLDDINLIAEDIPIIFTIRSRSRAGMCSCRKNTWRDSEALRLRAVLWIWST